MAFDILWLTFPPLRDISRKSGKLIERNRNLEVSIMREELDYIVKKHNLIDRTFKSFWHNYDCYLEEESKESKEVGLYDRDSINAELYGYAFCVTNELDFDCIKVYIDIFLKGNNVRCGDYWCIYDLDGNKFDDYFVIE